MSLMAFVKFMAFIIPLIIYILIITVVYPARNSGFIALGVLGSIVMGLGFVNIAGLIDKMYLGHIVTAILLTIGAFCVALSSVLLYTPSLYTALDESQITFYFLAWGLLLVAGLYYIAFRSAISSDLRRNGFSKTRIKKSMEGLRNYWWYENLKDEFSHKWLVVVNKLFTMVYLSSCLFHLLVGWWPAVRFITFSALIVLQILNFAMCYIIIATWKQVYSNRPRHPALPLLILVFPVSAVVALFFYFIKYM